VSPPPPPAPPGGQRAPQEPGRDRRRTPSERTTGRAELSRNPSFAAISPKVGEVDEEALAAALAEDPDGALVLLAEMVSATDEQLRAAARRLAAKVVLDRSRRGAVRRSGPGRPRAVRADRGGDLDLDASSDALLAARAEHRPPHLEDLVARDWGRQDLAVALLVDRSGSMGGARLATAALAAAACTLRAPADSAVLAFAREVQVLQPLGSSRYAGSVVDTVLRLRGHGTTALASALRAATDQLAQSRAGRRVTVLLSDCRATDGEDAVPAARGCEELLVLAPADDGDAALELGAATGARVALLPGAAALPGLLADLLR
jgi:Mg-chelatase subunit ChlD